jgi:hypothetical protein
VQASVVALATEPADHEDGAGQLNVTELVEPLGPEQTNDYAAGIVEDQSRVTRSIGALLTVLHLA